MPDRSWLGGVEIHPGEFGMALKERDRPSLFLVSFVDDMTPSSLVRRSLRYYWQTNLAVVAGVAIAVSVLAGALLVGDSVRGSLKELFLGRLGRASLVLSASHFFPEDFPSRIERHPDFPKHFQGICPLIVTQGVVTHQESRRRASEVQVYGVDERFWKFHDHPASAAFEITQRDAFVSKPLAMEAGIQPGDSVLLRLEAPSEIPAESLHGRKENRGRTVRLTASRVLPSGGIGEFSLSAEQQSVKAIFVPLSRLQKELEQNERINSVLIAEGFSGKEDSPGPAAEAGVELERIVRQVTTLEDMGIRLRGLAMPALPPEGKAVEVLSLERASTLLDESLVAKALEAGAKSRLAPLPVLTYLANRIRIGRREIPYSLVAAVEPGVVQPLAHQAVSSSNSGSSSKQIPSLGGGEGLRSLHRSAGVGPSLALRPAPGPDGPRSFQETISPPFSEPPRTAHSSDLRPPIWLNRWAADDLNARAGDRVTLEYYLWRDEGQLSTETAEFQLAGILPILGIAADRDLVPDYPGISDSDTLSDWDPPFPMDLGLIRPKDEAYWKEYRATPKAFIALADGQRIWRSRFGILTSLRFLPAPSVEVSAVPPASAATFRAELTAKLSPFETGFALLPVRAHGLAASRGATDFGEYFTYFSFFLVASALLLAALFFRLGVEQRLREVGLLKALGFAPHQIRRLFLQEGLLLATVGSLLGVGGAVAYGYLMVLFLRTWWIGAVGTTELGLYVSANSLLMGAAGGIVSAAGCVAWTLRRLIPAPPRGLLAGVWERDTPRRERGRPARNPGQSMPAPERARRPRSQGQTKVATALFGLLGGVLLVAAASTRLNEAAGFFGAGVSFLVSLLCLQSLRLRRRLPSALKAAKVSTLWRLGFRQASERPGRSVLCIALIASATFIIVAVDAFRRDGVGPAEAALSRGPQAPAPPTGTGNYSLMGQSLLPVFQNWNAQEGREALGFSEQDERIWNQSTAVRFRVRPGEDTSCLNLFQPRKPRILAPEGGHPLEGRFVFKQSLAIDEAEKRNPWRLLDRSFPDGAIPVIGDANSLAYVLHLKLGADRLLEREGRESVKLRVVAALDDSVFQRELLMSEENFKRLFPEQPGYRLFLFDVPPRRASELSQLLEDRLSDEGLDVFLTAERLAGFHRVENTYLSTFQFLGGLGLLLGTFGLAAVLLRNVLERRRELAVLRAVGYTSRQLAAIVIAENAFLLLRGAATGIVCALLAILPAIASRGWKLSSGSLGWLLLAVVLAGLAASLLAARTALRSPLLAALRSE
jgi:putative ABC transport system permease protein